MFPPKPKPDPKPEKSWGDTIDPIAKRLELAAMFGQGFKFNAEGASACAKLMREMARVIDGEVERRKKE